MLPVDVTGRLRSDFPDGDEHDLALSDDLFTVGGLELRTP